MKNLKITGVLLLLIISILLTACAGGAALSGL